MPIIHQRRVLGVLVVQQRDSRKFDESEEAFLVTLAAQLATAASLTLTSGNGPKAIRAMMVLQLGLAMNPL